MSLHKSVGQFADSVWQLAADAKAQTGWDVGEIASIDEDGTCTVTIRGTDFPRVHRLARYTPVVGHFVFLTCDNGQQLLIHDQIV